MPKFIPILRVGRYKDASGRNCDITPQVLTDIVESYESKSAPLVKGHPNNEAPAMGWIDRLKIVGNELQASFSDITEEFQHEVEQRSFKNISASFFMPLSDSNPSKGKHCLRHVGVLGASRPAIPNLGTLQEALAFSEDRLSITTPERESSPLTPEQMSLTFCQEGEELLLCFSEFAESEESVGFFEKLLKSAKPKNDDLLQELDKAKQELKELKALLLQKAFEEQIQQFVVDKKLDENKAKSFREMVLKYSQRGTSPEEVIANFSEFISSGEEVRTHRFGENTPPEQIGSVNFAENIEHTAVFADEVDKLCQNGMTRSDAYKQAKQNLEK